MRLLALARRRVPSVRGRRQVGPCPACTRRSLRIIAAEGPPVDQDVEGSGLGVACFLARLLAVRRYGRAPVGLPVRSVHARFLALSIPVVVVRDAFSSASSGRGRRPDRVEPGRVREQRKFRQGRL